jgi:hypothetical protein
MRTKSAFEPLTKPHDASIFPEAVSEWLLSTDTGMALFEKIRSGSGLR